MLGTHEKRPEGEPSGLSLSRRDDWGVDQKLITPLPCTPVTG
jgi:hypothetical protein